MVYKVSIHNKMDKLISFKVADPIVKVEPDDVRSTHTDSTITNLYIWVGEVGSVETPPAAWQGAVPTNTYLEVFDVDGTIEVFLENEKVPQHTIECAGLTCCGPNGCHYNFTFLLMVILILIAVCLGVGWFLYRCKRSKK